VATNDKKLLRVGELARAAGKSVRAIHLYEELGLLTPVERSQGGFRLFNPAAVARIAWINKLQVIGFSLSEIRDFVREFEQGPSARNATVGVRRVFEQKLAETRETLAQLQIIENDLVEAIAYLESCQDCATGYPVTECAACDHQGHEVGTVPELFAGLSNKVRENVPDYDVEVHTLTSGKNYGNTN
jgi:MerR family transcriptional regulator, copper efflux regulator